MDMLPMDVLREEPSDSSFEGDSDNEMENIDEAKKTKDATKEKETDAPEMLVRRENHYVTGFRFFVILVLMGAAAGVVTFVYRYAKDSENNSFHNEYDAVSTTIIDSFVADLSLKLYGARTLSGLIGSVYAKSNAKPWTLDFPRDYFFQACSEMRTILNAQLVAYSPIIQSEEARQEFESYATLYEEEFGPFTAGPHEACYLCPDPTHRSTTPDKLRDSGAGSGAESCRVLEIEALTGNFSPRRCGNSKEWFDEICSCGPREIDRLTAAAEAWTAANGIFQLGEDGIPVPEDHGITEIEGANGSMHLPIWQSAGLAIKIMPTMYDQLSDPLRSETFHRAYAARAPEFSKILPRTDAYYSTYLGLSGRPGSFFYFPVGEIVDGQYFGELFGFLTIEFAWSNFLTSIFPPSASNIDVVVENECAGNHTFKVDTTYNVLEYVGQGDLHERKFNDMVRATAFDDFSLLTRGRLGVHPDTRDQPTCSFRFMLYPTQAMEDEYITKEPIMYAVAAGLIFVFTSFVFMMYDAVVRRRQKKVMESAIRTSDIVTALFPKNVRDRMYEQAAAAREKEKAANAGGWGSGTSKMHMQAFLADGKHESGLGSEPIADLFPHATVCFIDIANFTAWSSERGPEEVFKLLEGLYREFDDIASKMRVFKVETIGDAYMAVCGAPSHRKDHAVVMARFAKQCLKAMSRLTRELETTLGPDTGDLKARVGLHSGPIIAGVLRGEKARFQLFGDTVNMASRMESTGLPNRIHASKETVEYLNEAGKSSWANKRKELVWAKGKGELQTFWLQPRGGRGSTGSCADSLLSESVASDSVDVDMMLESNDVLATVSAQWKSAKAIAAQSEKILRLVDWNVKVLYGELEKIVVARRATTLRSPRAAELKAAEKHLAQKSSGSIVIDELTHVVTLPEFDANRALAASNTAFIEDRVKEQLRDFTLRIANMYRSPPDACFHNFEHASHVMMSAAKMMKRIMKPEGINYDVDGVAEKDRNVALAREIHNSTYGMSSDPLMQFTVVFSALIHDVDHTGLTNKELIELKTPLAQTYREQSVAEQNSVDIAWNVLMEDQYRELRSCIYSTESELERFRELLVNAVMATDIADKQLQALRKERWADAFSEAREEARSCNQRSALDTSRKATIVFEHIIQASDVSHTMQHWNTFRKFNARLFEERYVAWLKGVAGQDNPSIGWYEGELGFFDYYVIPLARKLEVCGVFGVSQDEYLHHAQQNRLEWEQKGKKLTTEMLHYCENKYKLGMGSTPREEEEKEDSEV